MCRILTEISDCPFHGELRNIYLQAKAMELLVLQCTQMEEKRFLKGKQLKLSPNDIAKIHNARDILVANIQDPPSLTQLARLVGINDFKLKAGFKAEFSTSVFGYLNDLRLAIAKKNLLQRNKSLHLTMQIARQVYGIAAAENALIFFQDGSPAYITKRFDTKPGGGKWAMEDFAALAGKTSENAGLNFKYNYSYEDIGLLIKKYVAAWRPEMERFFSLVAFNYLFSNGDAHLKNFSLIETVYGDYVLSPAYDLINTSLHIHDPDFALQGGLFADGFRSGKYRQDGHACWEDFYRFGEVLEILPKRRDKLLTPFVEKQPLVEELIARSFLDQSSKKTYLRSYRTRRNFLKYKG